MSAQLRSLALPEVCLALKHLDYLMNKYSSLRLRRRLKFFFGVLATGICLAIFFFQINLSDTLLALQKFKWSFLFYAIIALTCGYVVRIIRWSIMLRLARGNTNFWNCIAPFLGSIAINNILPLRLGDVVRAFFFPKSMGITKTLSTSTLLIERLLDLLIVSCFFTVVLFISNQILLPKELKYTLILLGSFAVGPLLFFFLFSKKLELIFINILESTKKTKRIFKVCRFFRNFLSNFHEILKPKALLILMCLTTIIWMAEAGFFYFVMLGAGLNLNYTTAVFVMSITTLSTLVPSSPGYVGTFHLAAFTTLTLTGVAVSDAASASIMIHIALWLPTTLAGLFAMWTRPELISWTKIENKF